MPKRLTPYFLLLPVPQSNEATVSTEDQIALVDLAQGQDRELSLVLDLLLVRLAVLEDVPNADCGVVAAAGQVDAVLHEDYRGNLFLMSPKPAYDLQRYSSPDPDELLLFSGDHDEKCFGGFDEVDRAAVRVNILKVLERDRGIG